MLKENTGLFISVVIPSYNAEKTIRKCIDSLSRQTFRGDFEIILADSSGDLTAEVVSADYPRVKLIRFEKKTDPGTARNAGVKQAKGEVIAFIDADCEAAPDWI